MIHMKIYIYIYEKVLTQEFEIGFKKGGRGWSGMRWEGIPFLPGPGKTL